MIGVVKAFLNRKPRSLYDAGLRIGDLLADSTLIYRFGLKPTIANAYDIHATGLRIGNMLKALQSPQTYHGKFIFKLDGSPLGPGTLVTRTQVRFGGVKDDFVLKLLSLDALGLAPKSSNIWDVVAWSWFVDYFFAIGRRMSTADAVIAGLIRDLRYAVHSYTVYDTLYGPDFGFYTENGTIRHYFREVSRHVPMCLDGAIDYQASSGPDTAITSAILWGLLT
jgi:hypothetical protein